MCENASHSQAQRARRPTNSGQDLIRTMKIPTILSGAFIALSMGPALAGDTLAVFSSRHYDSDKEIYEAFTAETGIEIKLAEDKGDALLARLKQPGVSGDVLMTVDAGRLWAADKAGLFQPTRSEPAIFTSDSCGGSRRFSARRQALATRHNQTGPLPRSG